MKLHTHPYTAVGWVDWSKFEQSELRNATDRKMVSLEPKGKVLLLDSKYSTVVYGDLNTEKTPVNGSDCSSGGFENLLSEEEWAVLDFCRRSTATTGPPDFTTR